MDVTVLFNYLVLIFLTISMMSILWKENPLYRFAQYSTVGVAASVTILSALEALQKQAVLPILRGTNYWMIIPTVMGILIFTNQLGRKYNWISRYPLGLVLGVGTALALRGTISTWVKNLIFFISQAKIGTPVETINNLIFLTVGFCGLAYFFFYFLHRFRLGRGIAKIGRYAIMVTYGAGFGSALMMNIIFLTYVVMYTSFLGVPSPTEVSYTGAILLIAVIGVISYLLTKKDSVVRGQNLKGQET